jgi:capsular exopolysaccharide synthesis family protein
MSHLDAAVRRAAADGTLTRTVSELGAPAIEDTAPRRREFTVEESSRESERIFRDPDRLRDRSGQWDLEEHLPAEVLSQLGNLVEALAQHPASPRTIGFASPGRGEGTSTCVATLGAYLASRHARVLMVDANPHHPTLHTIARVDQRPGLSDLVNGDITLEAAPRVTSVPELYVLPSGAPRSNGSNGRLVPSAIHDQLLRYANLFDFVLVDCPPINAYGDAASIAAACEAVILVIDGNKTRREAAQSSKSHLTRAHCTLLGVFMNRRKFYIPQFVYNRL